MKINFLSIQETHFPFYHNAEYQPGQNNVHFKEDIQTVFNWPTAKMSSSEPSSPSSVLEATTPVLQKSNSNESSSDNHIVNKSDPWAFLEKELEEFQRIVAELEQIKIQKSKSGKLNYLV